MSAVSTPNSKSCNRLPQFVIIVPFTQNKWSPQLVVHGVQWVRKMVIYLYVLLWKKIQTLKWGKRRRKPAIWIVGMAAVQFLHHHFRHVKMVHGCLCKHFSAAVVDPFHCSHHATALHWDCSHVICCIKQEKVCCACYYKAAFKCINVSASHCWMLLQPLLALNCGACFLVVAVERHVLRIWNPAQCRTNGATHSVLYIFLKTSSL